MKSSGTFEQRYRQLLCGRGQYVDGAHLITKSALLGRLFWRVWVSSARQWNTLYSSKSAAMALTTSVWDELQMTTQGFSFSIRNIDLSYLRLIHKKLGFLHRWKVKARRAGSSFWAVALAVSNPLLLASFPFFSDTR
jgi:hypothetical protein